DELPSAFIAGVKDRLTEAFPQAVLFGEVWEDASNKIAYGKRRSYYLGKELDGVMNYPLRKGILSYLTEGKIEDLSYYMEEVLPNMPKRVADAAMNLLGTHDTCRVLTALGGVSPEGKTNDQLARLRMTPAERKKGIRRLICAYGILATLPGIPCVYYGDEAGLEGYSDPFNRMPFPWNNMEKELLSFYRFVGTLRQENKIYEKGECRVLNLTPDAFVFLRTDGSTAFATVFVHENSRFSLSLPDSAVCVLSSCPDPYSSGKSAAGPNVLPGNVSVFKGTQNLFISWAESFFGKEAF
ncbi:MAG: alpha-amylase family glycosyl hydrolase, partial [Clostridia bacterium]|nr:alpha-amylase family glycosyl hydrolase [Clostridia bacterium]